MPEGELRLNGPRELSLAVVGLQFANSDRGKGNRRFEALLCKPGEPVELRPEPRNPADPRAVAVFSSRGVQLGYLTAERAPWIGAKIRAGVELHAVFQELGQGIAIIRVSLGGGRPTLPDVRGDGTLVEEEGRADDDFQPDPEGPEWGA